ncbi:MAG: PDGLE domain-containing protein [Deltaproteobacteria bacterium]|uniref:PDGLE domain-containing protein n=1 Tax=Candidatus Zymogenus saltonus TaxID=2844893 RepID=A0A9D8KEY9_9DELT|nr:PDGLE domain-containing protein [Candidatus Zymogenus saltonus]
MTVIVVLFIIAIVLAFLLSPMASGHPDGLEKVAELLGFIDLGEGAVWNSSPMPDYTLFGDSVVSGMLAGLVGTVVMFGLGFGLAALLKKKKEV